MSKRKDIWLFCYLFQPYLPPIYSNRDIGDVQVKSVYVSVNVKHLILHAPEKRYEQHCLPVHTTEPYLDLCV